jgi:hypothetical protein
MSELFKHPKHLELWRPLEERKPVDWKEIFYGYRTIIDWPRGLLQGVDGEIPGRQGNPHGARPGTDPVSWALAGSLASDEMRLPVKRKMSAAGRAMNSL